MPQGGKGAIWYHRQVAEVYLSPDIAFPQYEKLQRDPRRTGAFRRVNEILDALEDDPRQRWLRTQRFRDPPLWCTGFDTDGEAWVILWSHDEEDEDRILVDYIGTASFG